MKRNTLIRILLIWLLLIVASFSWNYHVIVSNTVLIVENKARAFFDQILVTRAWNSSHGGVYVPVSGKVKPNLFLNDSLRDVTTIGGLKLTKINPAYMTRQIAEINQLQNDLQFHITSLKPIRPENRADAWETRALKSFENGNPAILELVPNDSTPQYRYMAPLITAKSCLQCHSFQGYKLDDIRGGISISFPSKVYTETQNNQLRNLLFVHVAILLLGFLGLFRYYKMENKLFAIISQKNNELEADRIVLHQTIAEKDKFFSIVAHDLRSPFNSFLGLTEIMVKDSKTLSLDEMQQIALRLQKSASNLFRLLENLLAWSRVKNGSILLSQENINLKVIVEENISIFADYLKTKEINITTDIPDEMMVFADSRMLQSVIRNLISNAAKFSHKGGGIHVMAKPTGDNLIGISVGDSGIGMSPKILDQLFRIDVQINRKGTDNEPSSGLGLLLCKEFVENMGGTIWAISEEGKGSVFHFTMQGIKLQQKT